MRLKRFKKTKKLKNHKRILYIVLILAILVSLGATSKAASNFVLADETDSDTLETEETEETKETEEINKPQEENSENLDVEEEFNEDLDPLEEDKIISEDESPSNEQSKEPQEPKEEGQELQKVNHEPILEESELGHKELSLSNNLISPMAYKTPDKPIYQAEVAYIYDEGDFSFDDSDNNHSQVRAFWEDIDGNFYIAFITDVEKDLKDKLLDSIKVNGISPNIYDIYGDKKDNPNPILTLNIDGDPNPSYACPTYDLEPNVKKQWIIAKYQGGIMVTSILEVFLDINAGGHNIGTSDQGFPIIISERDISVNKIWEGPAQDSVTINLLAYDVPVDNQTLTLDSDNEWSGSFENLPTVDEGNNEIQYTIEEDSIPGYTNTIEGNMNVGYTVTNTFQAGQLIVEKVDDSGTRITNSQTTFVLENNETQEKFTVETNNLGIALFDNLASGVYTLKETTAPEGYELDTGEYTVNVQDDEGEIKVLVDGEEITEVSPLKVTNKSLGSMEIKKIISNYEDYPEQDREFDIIVTGPDNKEYVVTPKHGEEGESVTIEGLKQGTYTIKEIVPMNYELVGITSMGVDIEKVEITPDNLNHEITVTNAKVNDSYFYHEHTISNLFKNIFSEIKNLFTD